MSDSTQGITYWRNRPRFHWIAVWLLLAAGSIASVSGERADEPGKLVASQVGTLPVILSAPHGGQDAIPGVPPRKGEGLKPGPSGFRAGRDTNTEQLALEVASAVETRLGRKPYYVVAKFHRKFVDANRPAHIAYEDARAGLVYDAYHQALVRFCEAVRKEFGYGLVLDLHGQGSAPDTVFRGTQNGKTDRALALLFGEEVHAGPASFCGLLAAQGITVQPTDTSRETSGYAGGYIVQTCGAREGIGAVQLEFGADLRKTDNLKATAAGIADAIVGFLKRYRIGAGPGQTR